MIEHPDVCLPARLRWFGYCGIMGATLLLGADWMLLGTLTSGEEFNATWLERLAAMPPWRLTLGGLAGPIGACLYVLGFWQLYLALRPGGRMLAFVCFAGFSTSFVCIAGSFHAAFPFVAYLTSSHAASPETLVVDTNYSNAMSYFGFLFYLGAIPALISVILLPYMLLRKQTRYPRWFALVNPALLWLCSVGFRYTPAPLGGLLVIGSGNIVFLLFFIISTGVLWRGGVTRNASVPGAYTRRP